jgi:AAA domain
VIGATPTRADAKLFVDRGRELVRIRRALDQGLNYLVHGERGSGKTSLIRHVMFLEGQHQLGDKDFTFVSGSGRKTPMALLGAVVEATQDDPSFSTDGSAVSLMQHLRSWAERSSRRVQPVLVLDDADPVVAHNMFGPLRDDLWELEVPWIVNLSTSGLHELMRPPVDAFFEAIVEMSGFSPDDAAIFLETRLRHRLPVQVVGDLVAAANGNPSDC